MGSDDSKFDHYLMGRKVGFAEGWNEARMQFLIRGCVPSLEEPEELPAPDDGQQVSES